MALRKVEMMHSRFGKMPGHKCGECKNLVSHFYDKTYFKIRRKCVRGYRLGEAVGGLRVLQQGLRRPCKNKVFCQTRRTSKGTHRNRRAGKDGVGWLNTSKRNAAKNAIYAAMRKHDEYNSCERKIIGGLAEADDAIDAIPAADVQPVRHGRWIESEIPFEKFVCSECGGACWYYDYEGEVARSRFCPNCGAKMDTEEQEAVYDPDKFFGRK